MLLFVIIHLFDVKTESLMFIHIIQKQNKTKKTTAALSYNSFTNKSTKTTDLYRFYRCQLI